MQNLNQLFFRSSTSQAADAVAIHGGLVSLFKRSGSNQWQCRFKLPNGSWHSMTTGKVDLELAKQAAVAVYEQTMAKISQELLKPPSGGFFQLCSLMEMLFKTTIPINRHRIEI